MTANDSNALAWALRLLDAFRRDDAAEALTLVEWHGERPDAPPPMQSATVPVQATDAANE